MNFVDEKFAAEKHSACAIARLTHSTQGAIDSNLCDVTQTRPGPRPGTTVHKIGYTKLDTQNWIHKIGQRITSGLAANPSSNSSQCREKAKSSMRHSEPNRRLMFVMRRFLYISISIQMLLYCIFRFVFRFTFPYWASWMIWSGFGVQTIALILLLAILPEIRVYARRKFFCEWTDPDRPRDHGHFTKNPNSWLTEFINFTELYNLEACIANVSSKM